MEEIKKRLDQYLGEKQEIITRGMDNSLTKKELKSIKKIYDELIIRISELEWVYKLLASN